MNKLRTERKARGMTLSEVAEAVGITTSNLSRIERALQSPSPAAAVRLYRFYEQKIPLETILNVPEDRAA